MRGPSYSSGRACPCHATCPCHALHYYTTMRGPSYSSGRACPCHATCPCHALHYYTTMRGPSYSSGRACPCHATCPCHPALWVYFSLILPTPVVRRSLRRLAAHPYCQYRTTVASVLQHLPERGR